jgi:hypothetical protein
MFFQQFDAKTVGVVSNGTDMAIPVIDIVLAIEYFL